MKTNLTPKPARREPQAPKVPAGIMDQSVRVAGGTGAPAAVQGADALLARVILSNLLWEDKSYEAGSASAAAIRELVPQVEPATVAKLAWQARNQQGLRHVPLFVAVQMLKYPAHRALVADLLPVIVGRADSITEALTLYAMENPTPAGKQRAPLASQFKIGLARSFANFDDYQLAKYQGKGHAVTLRDAARLLHPVPTPRNARTLAELKAGQVTPPDTWEVSLSAGANKRETFERLMAERRLPGLAFLRNLALMEREGVDRAKMTAYFETAPARWLLPINFIAAAKATPRWQGQIEAMMFRALATAPKLAGETVLIVDVSGSMSQGKLSAGSDTSWLDAAAALAMLAAEQAEKVSIYATSGSDGLGTHKTELLPARRGFALMDAIINASGRLGYGGIFTRQALDFVRADRRSAPAKRVIVFSDSQDCDRSALLPQPWGDANYIIDISGHRRGVNYAGIWTAEVVGWSSQFMHFIAGFEGANVAGSEEAGD